WRVLAPEYQVASLKQRCMNTCGILAYYVAIFAMEIIEGLIQFGPGELSFEIVFEINFIQTLIDPCECLALGLRSFLELDGDSFIVDQSKHMKPVSSLLAQEITNVAEASAVIRQRSAYGC